MREATTSGETPRVRMRIEHSRTIKEGWGYSSTVELTSGLPVDMDEIRGLLAEARAVGENERDMRNARDAALKEGF